MVRVSPPSAAVTAPADFENQSLVEQDSLAVAGPNGVVQRLPAYTKGATPITLVRTGQIEIKAQSLFSVIESGLESRRPRPRFAIRVIENGQTIYQQRYSADEMSLSQA